MIFGAWAGRRASSRHDDHADAHLLCAQLLLAEEDPRRDILLLINSPDGSVSAGPAIYDTMAAIRPDVATVAIGPAASMGQVLLSAGAPGKRFSLPHSMILMHEGSAGVQGTAIDVEIGRPDVQRRCRATALPGFGNHRAGDRAVPQLTRRLDVGDRPIVRVLNFGPNPEAASDAWVRIDAFFGEHLRVKDKGMSSRPWGESGQIVAPVPCDEFADRIIGMPGTALCHLLLFSCRPALFRCVNLLPI